MDKKFFLFVFFLSFSILGNAQLRLKISGKDNAEKIADSIGYQKLHANAKSAVDASTQFIENARKKGYLEAKFLDFARENDSVFVYDFDPGNFTKYIHIYIGRNSELRSLDILEEKRDTIKVAMAETEAFMNNLLRLLETKGYSLAKLRLENVTNTNKGLFADLFFEAEKKRAVNDVVVSGYEKFPKGHKKAMLRKYRGRIFNQNTLKNIKQDFDQFNFISQSKSPEILFMEDSTKVFVYVEKARPNRFDGFVGFGNNDEGNLNVNGYLDLQLVNFLNSGERLNIYWKTDGNKQTTFNASIDLPYIFNSPLGLKAQLNIFKQDSTFQNTETALELGYMINFNSRAYLGYQSAESTNIQNVLSGLVADFNNSFVTGNFEFVKFRREDLFFPEQSRFNLKAGTGKRTSPLFTDNQIFAKADAFYNFYLNPKNVVHVRSQNYVLQSDNYITNELYRFGGINSIRGFNENSLQANLFTSLLTEYRYKLASSLYMHSIIDYGYFQDKTSDTSDSLLGLGFGFGILTKNGLFNIIYANGSVGKQEIKLANSLVHLSFKAYF